jgi:hypothetical protein
MWCPEVRLLKIIEGHRGAGEVRSDQQKCGSRDCKGRRENTSPEASSTKI